MKDGIFSEMFSHTMALKPLLLWTLILTLSVTVTATSFNLSSEITRFIPTPCTIDFRGGLSQFHDEAPHNDLHPDNADHGNGQCLCTKPIVLYHYKVEH
ncbi:hypothetical protein KHU50_001772, partial [Colletotrichum sp. SAR 10_65]